MAPVIQNQRFRKLFTSQLFLFVAQSNNRASTGFNPVEFSIQLCAYYPDKAYGSDRVFGDMLEQDRLQRL